MREARSQKSGDCELTTVDPTLAPSGKRYRVGRRCALFALLYSLFTLFLLAGCPGEDLTPPEVTIMLPAEGDSIAGATTFRARATDNTAVARVEFFADAARVGVDSVPDGSVFECVWVPAGMLPGTSHKLRCSATDKAGNRNSSPDVTVYIGAAAGTHHRGTIAANETWTLDSSPHIVDANLAVEAYLTIQPGVSVYVADAAGITVGAHGPAGLRAAGRPDSTITFTALSTQSPGAWNGIQFAANATPDSSVLRHCTVEWAGRTGALIQADAGAVAIDSCSLRGSSGRGIAASGNGLRTVAGTTIADCADYPVSLPASLVSSLGASNKLTGNTYNAIEFLGGTVTATDTWPNLGVPYHITGTLTIAGAANPLITVAPGCSLLFGDSVALRVGVAAPGGLRANGTYGRIIFAPVAGNWSGLEFWEGADPVRCTLNYCRVQGAGAGNASAITIYTVPIAISNTTVTGNAAGGIFCFNTGFARFENDTVTGGGGYPLHISAQHVPSIGSGNSFRGNGGFDAIEVAGGSITDNAQFRRQDVPYRVRGTIEVGSPLEPTLVIQTGVELRFDPGTALAVGRTGRACLLAIGSPDDSITLTADSARPGAWDGLELDRYTSNSSRLEYCRLLYGGGAGQGILFIDSCVPAIADNEIAYSSNYCIYLVDSDIDIDALRRDNWLHDWAPGFDDIFDEAFPSNSTPDREARSGAIR